MGPHIGLIVAYHGAYPRVSPKLQPVLIVAYRGVYLGALSCSGVQPTDALSCSYRELKRGAYDGAYPSDLL